ncbi:hypothetical protein [Phytobacter ursingii]|nr:hypothetical protein [Phytobacter ursingii]AKL15072.1 hypothetical protein AB182_28995 [Phytobacter ursingii]
MAENYLKWKTQSDRNMAIAVTKALREIHAGQMETIEKVKLGGQRLINYGSCFVTDEYYRSTCHEQWQEDSRLILSLVEIYNRNDVVLDMVQLYFQKTFKRLGDQKSITLMSYLKQKIGEKAYDAVDRSSKLALSLTIAKLIVSSADFQESHIRKVNEMSTWFVKLTTFYSKAQIAALAANKLKFQDSEYYQLLYREKLEMLYFLIEPQMSKIIYEVKSGGYNEEVIGDALYEILKR